jgi:hypothetical protein
VYHSVDDCNHGYKFWVTFRSRMRLNLPVMVLPTQGIRTLGHKKKSTWGSAMSFSGPICT